ncbi:MAG: DUF6760 family protein [Bdellovibrionales bacterium]
MKKAHEEIAFIAYHFHWGMNGLLQMEHRDRLRWCEEISAINRSLGAKEERNIFDV